MIAFIETHRGARGQAGRYGLVQSRFPRPPGQRDRLVGQRGLEHANTGVIHTGTEFMRHTAIFIPHCGAPFFFMDPPADDPTRWVAMEAYLRNLRSMLPARPDYLLVVSAHWEMPQPTVLAASRPAL